MKNPQNLELETFRNSLYAQVEGMKKTRTKGNKHHCMKHDTMTYCNVDNFNSGLDAVLKLLKP